MKWSASCRFTGSEAPSLVPVDLGDGVDQGAMGVGKRDPVEIRDNVGVLGSSTVVREHAARGQEAPVVDVELPHPELRTLVEE